MVLTRSNTSRAKMSLIGGMSGVTLPTGKYVNSIAEQFPSDQRHHKIESTISNRYIRDFLPINANVSNGEVRDNYIEFVLNSSQQEFYDCDSFALEMKIKITKADGTDLDPVPSHVSVIDGLGHRILSKSSLYLNGTPCENNAYFGLFNSLKTYTCMKKDALSSIGRNMYYKDLSVKNNAKTDEINFLAPENDEKLIRDDCRRVMHFVTPLALDISSSDFFLLNGVDIRLRFDLASPAVIINSYDNEKYKYNIQSVKLWAQKLVPQSNALLSMNRSLIEKNSRVEYIFERPVIKNYVYPIGQSILSLDNIFNGIIPHEVYLLLINQDALNGDYKQNAAYFQHGNVNNIQLDVNGNTVSSMSASFPNHVASMFHHTLSNLKDDNNLLTLESFKAGRTIHSWDLRATDCNDTLAVERTGNLRINIQSATPNTDTMVVFVIGITTGLLEIDSARRVHTSYLM